MLKDLLIKTLIPLVVAAINAMTPSILAEIRSALLALHAKAKATDNPYDDIVTGLLLDVFQIQRPA